MVSGRRQRGSLGGILFVFGDIALDVIVRNGNGGNLAASDVITGSITANPGGSAANCAVDAARLGAAVAFVGVTGRDPIAEWLVADLGRNGVDAGFV